MKQSEKLNSEVLLLKKKDNKELAIDKITEYFKNGKTKSFTMSHSSLLENLADFSISLRRIEILEYSIFCYKNLIQDSLVQYFDKFIQNLVFSIETNCETTLPSAVSRIKEAFNLTEEYPTDEFQLDFLNVTSIKLNEEQEQIEMARFQWKALVLCLNNTKNHSRLKDSYNKTLDSLLQFLLKFERKFEFGFVAHSLRKSLDICKKTLNTTNKGRNKFDLTKFDDFKTLFSLRVQALDVAVVLGCKEEGIRIFEDINYLVDFWDKLETKQARKIPAKDLIKVHLQLSNLLHDNDFPVFHAFGLVLLRNKVAGQSKFFQSNEKAKSFATENNLDKVDNQLALAILSLGANDLYANYNKVNPEGRFTSSQTNQLSQFARILKVSTGLNVHELTNMFSQISITDSLVKSIYSALTEERNPLRLAKKGKLLLENLQESYYAQYTENIKRVFLLKTVDLLKKCFSNITFEKLSSISGLSERYIVDTILKANNKGVISVKVEFATRVLSFTESNNQADVIEEKNKIVSKIKHLTERILDSKNADKLVDYNRELSEKIKKQAEAVQSTFKVDKENNEKVSEEIRKEVTKKEDHIFKLTEEEITKMEVEKERIELESRDKMAQIRDEANKAEAEMELKIYLINHIRKLATRVDFKGKSLLVTDMKNDLSKFTIDDLGAILQDEEVKVVY